MNKKILALSVTLILCAGLLTGCGDKKTEGDSSTASTTESSTVTATPQLADIAETVKTAYGEEYKAEMDFPVEMIEEKFGLKSDMYEEVIAKGPMMSVHADVFLAVKAKSGKSDEVKKVLEDYREVMTNDHQYPSNIELVHASQVVQKGDYVFYVLLGQIPMEIQDTGDSAKILKAAEEQIALGVNAINKAFE